MTNILICFIVVLDKIVTRAACRTESTFGKSSDPKRSSQ